MNKINNQIEKELKLIIKNCRNYLYTKSIRESVEDYRKAGIESNKQILLENEPDSISIVKHNQGVYDFLYNEFINALENESEFNLIISKLIRKYDTLDKNEIVDSYVKQLENLFFSIQNKNESISGVLFEFNDLPIFTTSLFANHDFEVTVKTPKYIEYGNCIDISKKVIEFDFSNIAKAIFDETYDEIIWEFENEIEFFHIIKEMHINFTYLCLHYAFKSENIQKILKSPRFKHNAVFYGGEHDMEKRTIFINNN